MQDPVYEEAYQGHTIKIYHDPDTESPWEWCNLGTLICWHRRYRLGDSHRFDSPQAFLRDLADVSDQSDLSMDQLRERAERKAILLPVFLYDHSGLAMNTIGFHCPWDSGQVGFVYAPLEAVRKEFGAKRVTKALRDKVADVLRGEIVSYDAYLGGRVYGYVIERDGEVDQLILRDVHSPAAAELSASPPPELKRARYSYILFMRILEVSMASTSVTLGPHWDEFIALMLKEGRYGSTSELIRASLRLMEEQEGQRARLRVALMEGKQSGDAGPLDMDEIKREARSRSGASDA